MNEKKQKQRGFKQGVELIYKYRFVLSFLLLIMLVCLLYTSDAADEL